MDSWLDEFKRISYSTTYNHRFRNAFIRGVEKVFIGRDLKHRYKGMREMLIGGTDVAVAFSSAFGIQTEIRTGSLQNIPATGPVMITCNHPYGIIDGLAVATAVKRHRPDLKILAHQGVSQVPSLREYFLPILFHGTDEAKEMNRDSIRKLKNHLAEGGCVVMFPSGAVSTRLPIWKKSEDPPWHPAVAKWALEAKASMVPVFIEGQNSLFFHIASHLGMTMRLSTLLWENYKRLDTAIGVHIGPATSFEKASSFKTPQGLCDFVRMATYSLRPVEPKRHSKNHQLR